MERLPMKKLLCVGVGQLNRRVGNIALENQCDVVGIRRSSPDPALGFPQLSLNVSENEWPDVEAETIVVALSAGERSIEAYRNTYVNSINQLSVSLKNWKVLPKRIVVVSSSRVYGENKGEWINDDLPPQTADDYGKILLEMETLVKNLPVPTIIVRLSGIYAPGRDWLKRMALKSDSSIELENSWTNRIHIDDAANAIWHVLNLNTPQPSYIVSDIKPVHKIEMYNYFRDQQGIVELKDRTELIAGKRLSPSRLLSEGFKWQYPDAFSGGYQN